MTQTQGLEQKADEENFPVALRILPARLRSDLLAAYRYARHVDDLGDQAPGDRRAALEQVADDVHRLYGGRGARLRVVRDLEPLARDRGVPESAWTRLVQANLQDQEVSRYESFEDLLGYCALSANPVGEIVLHVFGRADAERVALSDRVCTALQLIEHWQDVGEDFRNGRVYLPQQDMRAFGVRESMLGADRACGELRDLVAYETDRAVAWLGSGAVLVSSLRGWARLAVSGYVSGGLAAAALLRRSGHDPLAGVPKPAPRQVAGVWLAGKARRPG